MLRPTRIIGALVVLVALVTVGMLLRPTASLSQNDLHFGGPVERPFDMMIRCDVQKESGSMFYGSDAPIGGYFVGCLPQGSFYSIEASSTEEEACESKLAPEIAFGLTASGEVRNATLIRSSGSRSVDQKILQVVRDGHYPPTDCGTCDVIARVPIDLKCSKRLVHLSE